MGDRFGFRLLVAIALVGALAAVGFYTYNLGLARGMADAGQLVAAPGAAPGTAVPVVIWPRPWFGFGFFPFFPLMILFWIFLLRGLFWRGAWRRRGCRYDARPDERSAATPRAAERTT